MNYIFYTFVYIDPDSSAGDLWPVPVLCKSSIVPKHVYTSSNFVISYAVALRHIIVCGCVLVCAYFFPVYVRVFFSCMLQLLILSMN